MLTHGQGCKDRTAPRSRLIAGVLSPPSRLPLCQRVVGRDRNAGLCFEVPRNVVRSNKGRGERGVGGSVDVLVGSTWSSRYVVNVAGRTARARTRPSLWPGDDKDLSPHVASQQRRTSLVARTCGRRGPTRSERRRCGAGAPTSARDDAVTLLLGAPAEPH